MKRFLLCFAMWGMLFSVDTYAETEFNEEPIEIEETETPEAGIRKSTKIFYSFAGMSMLVVACGALIIVNRPQTRFALDNVSRNFDGSYKVTISINNGSKKSLMVDDGDGLNILSGSVLVLNNQITREIEPGNNECAFVAIINKDSEFELKVGKNKFIVSGKDLMTN